MRHCTTGQAGTFSMGGGRGGFNSIRTHHSNRYTATPVMLIFETQKYSSFISALVLHSADSSALKPSSAAPTYLETKHTSIQHQMSLPTFHTNRHPVRFYHHPKSLSNIPRLCLSACDYVPHPSVKIPGIHHLSTCKIKQSSSFFFHVFYPLPLSP